jgi:guanylate kinase
MSTLFIISAPSGSGKSTLVKGLMERDERLRFSISYTTRQPRGKEKTGTSYYFISREEFETRLAKDEFLEHAEVFGNYYGTHVSERETAAAEGKDLLLDIDVQGAQQLKERVPDAILIFVLAPSRSILEKRLRARGEDSEEVIARRLRDAANEIRAYEKYDYVLVNDVVADSVNTLLAIVQAERTRRTRVTDRILPILQGFEEFTPEEQTHG